MYKKFFVFFLVLGATFTHSYGENSERVTMAKIEAAQKALQSMDNRWTTNQLATLSSALGIVGALYTLHKGNPDTQNTVLGICGGAVTAGGWLIFFGSNDAGNQQERMKLISVIENAKTSN